MSMLPIFKTENRLKSWGNFILPLLFFAIIGSSLMFKVRVQKQIITMQTKMVKLEEDIRRLKNQKQSLIAEIGTLSDPGKLSRAASVVHRMNIPSSDQIIKATAKDLATSVGGK